MKKRLLLVAVLLGSITGVYAQYTNVPDKNFEQALIQLGLDHELDHKVLTTSISGVVNLDVSSKDIQNLDGIEDFTNLESLNVNNNHLSGIDLTNNTALDNLDASFTALKAIDLTKNTALKSLNVNNNNLRSIDLTKNTALENLNINFNDLSSINLTINIALLNLDCSNNRDLHFTSGLTELDVSQNTSLLSLNCSDNSISSISGASSTIEQFNCSSNSISSLDVSSITNLNTLNCSSNRIEGLDVTNNPNLVNLYCSSNNITDLSFLVNHHYNVINLSLNKISAIDLLNAKIDYLFIDNNELENLDLKGVSVNDIEILKAYNNYNLTCICVDDVEVAKNIPGWTIGDNTIYSTNCTENSYVWTGAGDDNLWNNILNWNKADSYPHGSEIDVIIEGDVIVEIPSYGIVCENLNLKNGAKIEIGNAGSLKIESEICRLNGHINITEGGVLYAKNLNAIENNSITNAGLVSVDGNVFLSNIDNIGTIEAEGKAYGNIVDGIVDCSFLEPFYQGGYLVINGTVNGKINGREDIHITEGGVVNGNIELISFSINPVQDNCPGIKINGTLNGSIDATYIRGEFCISNYDGNILIEDNGVVNGNIKSQVDKTTYVGGRHTGSVSKGLVSILSGGVFQGKVLDGAILRVNSGGTVSGDIVLESGSTIATGAIIAGPSLELKTGISMSGANLQSSNVTVSSGGSLSISGEQLSVSSLTFNSGSYSSSVPTIVSGDITINGTTNTVNFGAETSCSSLNIGDGAKYTIDENTKLTVGGKNILGKKNEEPGEISVIDGAELTIDTTTEFSLLTLGSGSDIIITENGSLTVPEILGTGGDITINSTMSDSGSLILEADYGNVTYNRSVLEGNWHLIGAPVTGQEIFADATISMLAYSEADDDWVAAPTSGNFDSGKGYAIKRTSNGSVSFNGGVIVSDVSNIGLTRENEGWNMLSNPYPSAIKGNANAGDDNLLTANASQLDPKYAAIYIWDDSAERYNIYNNANGAKYIQAGQAFFLRAPEEAGTSASINSNMRIHKPAASFGKSAMDNQWEKVTIFAKDDANEGSTIIQFGEGMTKGLDITYDAGAFGADSDISLSTLLVEGNDVKFDIQCLPSINDDLVIPLVLEAEEGTKVSLTIETENYNKTIYLEDRLLNKMINLSGPGPVYTFTTVNMPSAENRFYIHTIESTLGVNDKIATESKVVIQKNLNQISFVGFEGNIKVSVFDISGKIIKTGNTSNNVIPFNGVKSGVYIIRIQDNNQIITKKILW